MLKKTLGLKIKINNSLLNFIEIDLKKLEHNYHAIRSLLNPETKMIGVVKANAYGNEVNSIAEKLVTLGIDALAVAYTEEGIQLRNQGIKARILVFYPQIENFKLLISADLEPALYSKKSWLAFEKNILDQKKTNYPVHIKYNTGLNRIGFNPADSEWVINEIKKDTFKIKSVYSHLGASEENRPNEFSQKQLALFDEIMIHHKKNSKSETDFHLLNTSGIFNYPELHLDWVRCGIGLYGFANQPQWNQKLKPIGKLISTITQIHSIKSGETVGYNCGWTAHENTRIAVLPLGHADGIARHYGQGNGWVSIHGEKAPIVGNICMDMIMVEIKNLPCQEGDEVEIFGTVNTAEAFAEKGNTISYELLSGLGKRIERRILK